MPVSIESKLVGTTPARFSVLHGALSVVVGETTALIHSGSPALLQASQTAASAQTPQPEPVVAAAPVEVGINTRALELVVPVAGRTVTALSSARTLVLPAATAILGIAAGALMARARKRTGA
jgi:hypothetical protein